MKLRKRFIIIFSILGLMGLLGGCHMFEKPSLTKEQQDNVVKRIARGYEIDSVEFLSFSRNSSTGYYDLLFRVNGKDIVNKISVNSPSKFNSSSGIIGLDPIEDFIDIEKQSDVSENTTMDINKIEISYLEE